MKAIIGILMSIAFSIGAQLAVSSTANVESPFSFSAASNAVSVEPESSRKWGQSQLNNYQHIKKKLRYLYASECIELDEVKIFSIQISSKGQYMGHEKVRGISQVQLRDILSAVQYHPILIQQLEQPLWVKISFDFSI